MENIIQTIRAYRLQEDRHRFTAAQAPHRAPVQRLNAAQGVIFAWRKTRIGTVDSSSAEGTGTRSSIVRFTNVVARERKRA